MKMLQHIKVYFSKKFLPRWLVLLSDLAIVLLTFVLAYLLRFNFNMNEVEHSLKITQLILILPVFLLSFRVTRSYSGILRHSTTTDLSRIIFSLGLGGFLLLIISQFTREYKLEWIPLIPHSVIIIQFALSSVLMILLRCVAKMLYKLWKSHNQDTKNVMIYGAGSMGQISSNALMMDKLTNTKLIGFIDDNISIQHKRSGGIPIYSAKEAFDKIIDRHKVTELVVAINKKSLSIKRKREIIDLCLPKNILVKEVPSVDTWMNGTLSANAIKKIRIEDILGRDAITLDCKKIKDGVKDAVILVAGAAGSIGSEIVNQLMAFNAYHVILLDKAESDLYDLQNDLIAKYDNPNFTVIVGDVTNKIKVSKIFRKFSPSVVINAAAYKHVPLMEEFPGEAIRVNIGGTRNLANLSVEYGVEKFVLVSTDKAVNPTNVMGASKRICEIYIQSLAQRKNISTQFITTRFGNVLGSNGSVIPLFKKQIERGGPITLTHRDITRFFMTIPEASQLVLEACFMGKGGEIFVFDMGEPVKIYDLAKKMIFLSGLIPDEDIKIKITGLRAGEKLYEELLQIQENLLPTYNDKIMIGKVRKYDFERINSKLLQMLDNVDEWSNQDLVEHMMNLVPEFVSKNSYYINPIHLEPKLKLAQVG